MILANFLPEHYCELDYTNNIVKILNEKLDDNFEFYFYYNECNHKVAKNKKTKLIFHVGNEDEFNTREYKNVNFVFRFYHTNKCDNIKIHSIPIGYNSSGRNEIIFENIKPIMQRPNNVFFYGQKNYRSEFLNFVNTSKYKEKIQFSNGFRDGLNIFDYYKELNNTKICLVPKGFSPETFRYIESFASGCVVITTEKLQTWYYQNSPAFFIERWDETVDDLIDNLLCEDLTDLQENGLDYYKKFLSPEACANYILNTLKNNNLL